MSMLRIRALGREGANLVRSGRDDLPGAIREMQQQYREKALAKYRTVGSDGTLIDNVSGRLPTDAPVAKKGLFGARTLSEKQVAQKNLQLANDVDRVEDAVQRQLRGDGLGPLSATIAKNPRTAITVAAGTGAGLGWMASSMHE